MVDGSRRIPFVIYKPEDPEVPGVVTHRIRHASGKVELFVAWVDGTRGVVDGQEKPYGLTITGSGTITAGDGALVTTGAMSAPAVKTVGYVNAYLDTNGALGYRPARHVSVWRRFDKWLERKSGIMFLAGFTALLVFAAIRGS